MNKTIQQYLGVPSDWKVKEKLRYEIILIPNKEDVRTAKRHDPLGCALRNTACRVFNVQSAAIGGGWAYIPQRDEKGKFYIARMRATAATQRAIKQFDEHGTIPEAGFRFIPVSASSTRKNKNSYMKKWSKGRVGRSGGGKRPLEAKYGIRIRTRTIPMNVKIN
jgi:hypothetical protein